MSKKRVILSLLPERVDVVAYQGKRRVVAQRLAIPSVSDAADWIKALRQSTESLRSVVTKTNLSGTRTAVLYRSPTQSVDLAGVPIRDGWQAAEASKLGCLNSLSYSAATAVCQASVVGRDAGGQTPQTHVVVAAERGDVAQALSDLTEAAGLKFATATPLDAAIIDSLARKALRFKGRNGGWLYVGEYTSYFVVGSERILVFHRRIDLGLESLAKGLTRPIHTTDGPGSIELDLSAARVILSQHGIPQADQLVHESPALTGRQVMPLIQPVIQRYIVELRQSLRFGLSEQHRQDLTIRVTGPGACVPGLAELVAQELGVVTIRDDSYDGYQYSQPGSDGSELADASWNVGLLEQVNLLPHELARRRHMGRLGQWLWTGAVAAAAVIAVEGFRNDARLTDARREARVVASRVAELNALQDTGKRLGAAMVAMTDLEKTIETEIGAQANFRAYLQELSRITPATIRFTVLKFDRRKDGLNCAFTGYAIPNGPGDEDTDLDRYVQSVRASPLFHDVVLSHVQMESLGNIDGQRFQMALRAVTLPRDAYLTPVKEAVVRGPAEVVIEKLGKTESPTVQQHEALLAQRAAELNVLDRDLSARQVKLEALHRMIKNDLAKLNQDRAQFRKRRDKIEPAGAGDDPLAAREHNLERRRQELDAKHSEIQRLVRRLVAQQARFNRQRNQFLRERRRLEQQRSHSGGDAPGVRPSNERREREKQPPKEAGVGDGETTFDETRYTKPDEIY